MPRPAIVACFLIARALCAGPAEDHLRAIRRVELDPQRCYRVRDVFLEREDVKLYFTDGHLIFGRKVHGRDIAAAFVASEPTDIGEVLIIPPTPGERRSAARFLDETVINEKFRTAVFFFTDDTADALRRAVARSPVSRADAAAGDCELRPFAHPSAGLGERAPRSVSVSVSIAAVAVGRGGEKQNLYLAAGRRAPPAQARREHAAIVEHQQIAGAEMGGQVAEDAMRRDAAAAPVHNHQAGRIARLGGRLGNQLLREAVVEIGCTHGDVRFADFSRVSIALGLGGARM